MLWHKEMRIQEFEMHFLLFHFVTHYEKFADAFRVLL